MEKKVKIYSILISIIYCLLIISTISEIIAYGRKSFKQGWDRQTTNIYIRTSPIKGSYTFPQSTLNTLTGEEIGLEMRECMLKVPITHDGTSAELVSFITGLIGMCFFPIIIYIPILFFMIIKEIWKNNILNHKLMKRIKRMGWILISLYLFILLSFSLGQYYIAFQQIALTDYKPIFEFSNTELLILGLVTLMLGEILNHTLKMKEEQELTI